MAYNFTAEWVKVSLNGTLDALSCYPVSDQPCQKELAFDDGPGHRQELQLNYGVAGLGLRKELGSCLN